MNNRDIKFINGGSALEFNDEGFAVNAEGQTAIAFSGDYRNQVLTVVGTGTVKVYGSCQKSPPDFSSPSTIDNSYCPIMLADYTTPGTYYAGGTGVTVSNSTKIVELNTNLLTWIAIQRIVEDEEVVDVKFTETDNQ